MSVEKPVKELEIKDILNLTDLFVGGMGYQENGRNSHGFGRISMGLVISTERTKSLLGHSNVEVDESTKVEYEFNLIEAVIESLCAEFEGNCATKTESEICASIRKAWKVFEERFFDVCFEQKQSAIKRTIVHDNGKEFRALAKECVPARSAIVPDA